jgi:cytochrome c biogenesis protein
MSDILKKPWKLLSSMKFGVALLLVMAVSSIAGTVIPQGREEAYYISAYGKGGNEVIGFFQFDRVFSSWWFVALVVLLLLNLFFCSIMRLPSVLKEVRKEQEPALKRGIEVKTTLDKPDALKLMKELGFRKVQEKDEEGGSWAWSGKNRIGPLGSWLLHLGILIVILAYYIGRTTGFETFVYGVPGTSHRILDTGYTLSILDFDIELRQDYTVNQYISDVRVDGPQGSSSKTGRIIVNGPMRVGGMSIYQSGTGWALKATLEKAGVAISEKTLYQSEVYEEGDIALYYMSFYPDFTVINGNPATLSPLPKNPKYVYAVYYKGQMVMMDAAAPGEEIRYLEYTFRATDPTMFTYLQIVRDPALLWVSLGGALMVIGAMFAFFLQPKEIVTHTSKGVTRVWGWSRRNQAIFTEDIRQAVKTVSGGES